MGHLIHRQILELKFTAQDDAQRWSARLSELNQRIVLPELERAFSELVGDSKLLRIERLEIDLGSLKQSDFENDLAKLVRQSIKDALQPYLHQQQPLAMAENVQHLETRSIDKITPNLQSLDADSLQELFQLFLLSGRCPWWLKRELAEQLDLLYQRFWQLAPDRAGELMRQMISEPVALHRFIEQFSNRSHLLTLRLLLPPDVSDLLVDLRKLATRLLVREDFGYQAGVLSLKLVYGLIAVSETQQFEEPNALLRQFFIALARVCEIPLGKITEEIDRVVACTSLSPSTMRILAELLRQVDVFTDPSGTQSRVERIVPELKKTATEQIDSADKVHEVVVENAGLVLLWPHLKEILGKLDLLEVLDDGYLQPKHESVLLLQQLATGRVAGQENLLLLNKLLCGIPQSVPVPRRHRRTRLWDTEVEALLSAVVKQWSVLKNTSPDGLRSSFLQREGVLREQGLGWRLQVERKTHDILLEQLPWGLGMIQFSWMRQPLQIEW